MANVFLAPSLKKEIYTTLLFVLKVFTENSSSPYPTSHEEKNRTDPVFNLENTFRNLFLNMQFFLIVKFL